MGRSQLSVDELRNGRQETQSAYLSGIHPNHREKSAAGYILCSLYSALSGLTPYVGHYIAKIDKSLTCRSVFLYYLILAKTYLLVSSSLQE